MAIAEYSSPPAHSEPVEVADAPLAGATPRWRAIGASVRGAAHTRNGVPNQDAIAWLPAGSTDAGATQDERGDTTEGASLVMAVSDGHGSAKCFRSATGARLAVDTALDVIGAVATTLPDVTDLSILQDTVGQIVSRWRAAVAADILRNPLTNEEFDTVEQKGGVSARRGVERRPSIAYGATLLAVLVSDRYLVYFQLGDGDILAVSEGGKVSRPLADDPQLFADETTSLCSPDAVRHLRVGLHVFGEGGRSAQPAPALIVLSTDGYANSFRTEADFVKVGADLLELVREEGLEMVGDCLEAWLQEASSLGSGDDVTVGIVCRADGVGGAVPAGDDALSASAAEGGDQRVGEAEAAVERGSPPDPL